MTQPNLTHQFCIQRQQRVRDQLEKSNLERALFVSAENIQYLTGFRPHRLMQALVCLDRDGECVLVTPNQEAEEATADCCIAYPAQLHATLVPAQFASAMSVLNERLKTLPTDRIGLEASTTASALMGMIGVTGGWVDIDPIMWALRRKKDPDELQMIHKAIACTEAMYVKAREIIEPGISELEVYNQLHAAAVLEAGEQLTALGNDFQCNSPGGPPRNRKVLTGELYILDLGPAYRGYYADNCRTIAVNRTPTDEQLAAWEAIVAVLRIVEQTVKPGVVCRELFEQAQAMLDELMPGAFFHHLGHGFGLYPHETPYLNPNWEDVFQVGDVFTAEPGLYTESLRAGIRLEQDYLVTEKGVERLTNFPLELS